MLVDEESYSSVAKTCHEEKRGCGDFSFIRIFETMSFTVPYDAFPINNMPSF